MKTLKKILTLMLVLTLTLQYLSMLANRTYGNTTHDFNIVHINVRSSADTADIYPGSRGVTLKIQAVYQNDTPAMSVVGWLNTTEGISFNARSGACSPAQLLNGSIAENVSKGVYVAFEYLLDISRSVNTGNHTLWLNITYVRESIFTHELHPINVTVSPYPPISLRVVDAYFSPASYPDSVDTNLYVILENNGSTITSTNFNITLPENFTIKNPRASTGLVNRGDRFTLTFTGISIPTNAQVGFYNGTIYADCSARTEDGVAYSNTTMLNVKISVESPPPEEPIMMAAVNTLYNGVPAPLLPSARNAVLRVYLINRLTDAISAMALNITVPDGMHVRAVSGTYINGMVSGGTCYVDITLDIDSNVAEGKYDGVLNVTYLKIVSGASFLLNQTVSFPINVESVHSYMSELVLVSAYWGYPDPTPVYSISRYVPLTIRLVNYGRYDVWGVVVNASSRSLMPIKDSEACAATVARGGSCTAVFYFDIDTTALSVPVDVSANYIFAEFGTHISAVRNFTVSLPVEIYPASESILSIVDAGWQNGVNVFPQTSNATYQVTLANRAPYSISGINLKLKLPEGIASKGRNEATSYIEGPIRSLATFTASFTISVDNIQVGSYNANLTVDCILLSGGPGVRRIENFTVQIFVNDDVSALEIVESRWYEGTVGPQTYGAHLIVLIRNVYVDGLHGAILEIDLPEGIYNAIDNSSHIKATPLSVQLQLPLQQQNLAEILNAFLSSQQANPAQVYGRGDILTFTLALNLFDVEVGSYTLDGRLSYIDLWGGSRKIPLTISVAVLGKAGYIEVAIDQSISVRSRYVNTSLTLVNHGSTPMYDVYIAVSPYQGTPILIASPTVNHVEKIDPGKEFAIPITLAYNPIGFYAQTGAAPAITYGPVPLIVSVFYRDASGYYRTFNNSVTVVVEPFIELLIRNVRGTGTNASSTVTGILVNYGSSTAYRVEVELKIGDTVQSENIGDVGPGEEVAFRVDVDKYNATALLTMKYYNIFNERESKEMNVSIALREEAAPPITHEEWTIERWIIVAGVIVFLAIAAVMIYRMLKKTRLEATV
ncbi:MAG: hypothetical protein QHH12_07455 [Candidatus Bathyarchaeota archaeon]|jgi:hypothetical protein|nr:hypothetical protein [Candidatus Bathyarchaeota archaeon A05DMB-3]MDH7607575.1 hypothetical protein [Candidatus Bathyarchaeota archaeon]